MPQYNVNDATVGHFVNIIYFRQQPLSIRLDGFARGIIGILYLGCETVLIRKYMSKESTDSGMIGQFV